MRRRFHSDFLPNLHFTDATGHLGRLDPSCYDLHAGIQHLIIPLQRGERADRAVALLALSEWFLLHGRRSGSPGLCCLDLPGHYGHEICQAGDRVNVHREF